MINIHLYVNLVPRVSLLPTSLSLRGVGRRETLGTRLYICIFSKDSFALRDQEKHCLTNWCQLLFICPCIDHGHYYTTLLKLLGICRLNFQLTALWQNCQQGRCMRTKTDVNNLCFTITTNQLSNSQLLLIDTSQKNINSCVCSLIGNDNWATSMQEFLHSL